MLSHTNLYEYYQKIFGMVQHHKYSIAELEKLMPYELQIYYEMLIEHIKELEEKNRNS